jgi:flagellar protein FlgJ
MATTPVVTDFSGYTALKAKARADDPAAIKAAAQQFEALFTQMMLKSMRDATLSDGTDPMTGGEQGGFYRDMFDQQLALTLSSGKGLGLADMLVKQMTPHKDVAPAQTHGAAPAQTHDVIPAKAGTQESSVKPLDSRLRGNDEYIEQALPAAKRAGLAIGVAPHMLIAQSALESKWGRSVAAGSNNVFGIKAGASWKGATATVTTHEYENGKAHLEQAAFRAYRSVADSFADYAKKIGGDARYASVVNAGSDSAKFAQGLQQAGYATDPSYAQKIRSIADDPAFQDRVRQVAQRLGIEV